MKTISQSTIGLIITDIQQKDDDNLRLILLVHENCNFRCTYCYERFEKNKMKKSVTEGITRFVENKIIDNPKLESVTISWFGGEPLLSLDIILKLGAKVKQMCEEKGVKYFSDMTTNGFMLTANVYEKLVAINVKSFQVTLDGQEDYHNSLRKHISGKGTYKRIVENLVSIKESTTDNDETIIIRTNVGQDNYESVESHIEEISNLFKTDDRFMLSFHNIGNWGERESNIIEESVTMRLQKRAIELGANVVPIIWNIAPGNTCYASKSNSFVIGSDGIVYKCTVALYEDINKLGFINSDGMMEIDGDKDKKWWNRAIENKCDDCALLPSCLNNKCPLDKLTKNSECLVTDWNMKEAVKILALQDLITYEIS